jgi:hypothetical protein
MSRRTIQSWAAKKIPSEMSHKSQNKPPKNKIDFSRLERFLANFQYYESHYTRDEYADKRILPPCYTVKLLFDEFVEHCKRDKVQVGMSESSFYKYIQLDAKITIHVPQKDTCSTCDKLRVAILHI